MVEKGKKIWVKNKVFEIIQDENGLTLYEILSNGTRQEAIVDKDTFISIIVAMSDEKKNRPEIPSIPKMAKSSKIKAALSLITVIAILISNGSFTKSTLKNIVLNKSQNYSVANSDYLKLAIKTNPHLPAKMIPVIEEYAEVMEQYYPEYQTCDQLYTMNFINYDDFNNDDLSNAVAFYKYETNTMGYLNDSYFYKIVPHELLHSASIKFTKSCKNFGLSLVEGITAQLEWELFGTHSYFHEPIYASLIALTIGGDKLSDIYFDGTINDLKKELLKYCDEEELNEAIKLADKLKEQQVSGEKVDTNEAYKVHNFFNNVFYNKINTELDKKLTISEEEYESILEDIYKFKATALNIEKTDLENILTNLKYKATNISQENIEKIDNKIAKKYESVKGEDISYISTSMKRYYVIDKYQDSNYLKVSIHSGVDTDYIKEYPYYVPDENIAKVITHDNNLGITDISYESYDPSEGYIKNQDFSIYENPILGNNFDFNKFTPSKIMTKTISKQ